MYNNVICRVGFLIAALICIISIDALYQFCVTFVEKNM